MSNVGVLLSLLALLVGGLAVGVYALMKIQETANLITTGVSPCGPVSMRYRWLTLFNTLLPLEVFVAASFALIALGSVEVGEAVTDDRVRMLANFIAVLAGFASFFGLIQGGSMVLILASDLRKASQSPLSGKRP